LLTDGQALQLYESILESDDIGRSQMYIFIHDTIQTVKCTL